MAALGDMDLVKIILMTLDNTVYFSNNNDNDNTSLIHLSFAMALLDKVTDVAYGCIRSKLINELKFNKKSSLVTTFWQNLDQS